MSPNVNQGLSMPPEPPPEETEKTTTHDFSELMDEGRDTSMPRSDEGTLGLSRAEQTLAGIRAVQVRAQSGQLLSPVEQAIVEAVAPPAPSARRDERTWQIVCKLDTPANAATSGRTARAKGEPFSPVTSRNYAACYEVIESIRHDLASRAPETDTHWAVLANFLEEKRNLAMQTADAAVAERTEHIEAAGIPAKHLEWAKRETGRWWDRLQQSIR